MLNKNTENFIFLILANFGVLPIALISNVILARYLGTDRFGDYTYLVALVTFFTTFFTFGFFQAGGRAILLSSNKSKIKQYYGSEVIILFFLYFLLALFFLLYLYFDLNIKNKKLEEFIPIVVLIGWVFLLRRYYDVLFQSDKRIKLLAFSKLMQPILFLSFLLLWSNLDLTVIFYFVFCTHLITAFMVFLKLKPIFKNIKKRIIEIWLYNKKFGFNIYLGSVLPLSLSSFSSVFISYNSDSNSGVGFYAIALSFSTMIAIIPNTMATVLFKNFNRMRKIPIRIVFFTVVFSLVFSLVFITIVDSLVFYFYGREYEVVSYLVKIMVFGLLAHGMGDFYNRYLSANGYSVFIRNSAVLTGVILFLLNIILIPKYQEVGAAVSTLVAGFFYFIAMLIGYFIVIKNLKRDAYNEN